MATSLLDGWDNQVRTNPASGLNVSERPWNGARDANAFGVQPATGNPNVPQPGMSSQAQAFAQQQAAAAAQQNAVTASAQARTPGGMPPTPAITPVAPPVAAPAPVGGLRGAWNSVRSTVGGGLDTAGKELGRAFPTASTAMRVGGAALGAVPFIEEGVNTARVASNPDSTGVDVATQAAQGAGRAAAATYGAAKGAQLGGALGLAGRVAGGVIGGVGGYFGANKLIEQGREQLGTVTASPMERLNPNSSGSASLDTLKSVGTATPATTNTAAAQIGQSAPQAAATQPAAPMGLRDQVYAADGAYNPNVIVRQGNSYSGGNVGANAQMFDRADNGTLNLRNPGGGMVASSGGSVSPQNQAAARSLASAYGQQTTPWSGVIGQESGVGNMWSRSPEQLRRDAEVQASSIHKPTSARGAVALKALNDQDLQGVRNQGDFARADAGLQGDLARSAATRYSADQNLAGDMAKTAATGRNGLRDAQLKMTQNQGLAQALQAAGGDPVRAQSIALANGWDPSPLSSMATQRTAENKAQQDLARDAGKAATDRFAVYRTDKDGKQTRDDQATQHRLNALNGVIPGFSTMGEEAQAQHIPRAQALMGIWDAARNQNTEGFGSLFSGIGGKPPQLDTMPNFQGGELRRNGLAGTVIPGASSGGYYISKGGKDYSLGNLSQDQIELIQQNTRTGKW